MAQENQGSGTAVLGYIAVALIAFAAGFFLGNNSLGTDGPAPNAEVAQGAAALPSGGEVEGDSAKIPIGDSPILGKADAPITVIEFSDFQCPYCSRGGATVKQLQEKYPNDVKVVFKHFPLAFHKQAPDASKAAMIAGDLGNKFWEMHDLLFQNQKQMKTANMKELTGGLAKQLGLDVAAFNEKWDDPKYAQVIKDDMALGSKLGVRGTPHFFINGERLSGAQPINKFEEIVKSQLAEVKKMQQAGVAKDQIYAKMVEKNYADAEKPKPQQPQGQKVEMVPVSDNEPMKGNTKDPLITIVEFSDFQCPFCSRVNPTLDQVMKNFGDDVRIVFKQNPLPFHKEAPAVHDAALAAHQQGKFWEMHDLLFTKNKEWKGQNMDELVKGYAQQLGLNMAKFNAYYDSNKGEAQIKEDQALANKVGARGTPNFFVNGVQLIGAKPYPAFEEVIKKQLDIAKKLKKEKNLSGDALYKAAVAHNKANAPAAPAAAPTPDKPEPKVDTNKLKVNGSFTKGPKNAPVTIYEFSDFQCPYCSRANNTLQEAFKEYPGKIQIVFKAFPLPFHKEAEPAHRAALAAGQQGKFWEMHDKIFSDQKALKTPGVLDKYAQELGLNMAKYNKAMESAELKKQVQDEMAMGKSVGVRGTPAFFINGTRLVGAQPLPKFKQVIDAELK